MSTKNPDYVPQVVAIVPVSADGTLRLKKEVRAHLGDGNADFRLISGEEVVLTAQDAAGERMEVHGNRFCLSVDIAAKLQIKKGSLVAMVERPGAVALKKLDIEEHDGEAAKVYDIETARAVTRVVETNPTPEKLLPKLKRQYKDMKLAHNVVGFLRGRTTLAAWKARKLIGAAEATDKALRQRLLQERLAKQARDGSWEGRLLPTARNLREIAELGLGTQADQMQAGVRWLLRLPQSKLNPGMFFLTDRLVAQQAEVVEQRRRTGKGRFRELKASEMRAVAAGDDLMATKVCGPRIMWPNALVLETLLLLGYEKHERVQAALDTILRGGWCECGYQHGAGDWRGRPQPTTDEVEEWERTCLREYTYGGIPDVDLLRKMDLTRKVGVKMPRVARIRQKGKEIFPLRMATHLQGCEVITARAMSRVRSKKMRRIAEAYLWRFAARQNGETGAFAQEKYGYCQNSQVALLDVFARFAHPASEIVIMRSIPWIVNAQNEDGSWGDKTQKDVSTRALLAALHCVRPHLPRGLTP